MNNPSIEPNTILNQNNANSYKYFRKPFCDTELVFGIVGAVGTDLRSVIDILSDKLKNFYKYDVVIIDVSAEILRKFLTNEEEIRSKKDEFERVSIYMDKGNELRKSYNEGILAMAVADIIQTKRAAAFPSGQDQLQPLSRTAFIIRSIKNKMEIEVLRAIYDNGFYLIGVHEDENQRLEYLNGNKNIPIEDAKALIKRDEDEQQGYGQQTRDAYQQADLFVDNSNKKRATESIDRFIKLVFCEPYTTPTFAEFAMYLAHGVALRSADLSRQVGAVISRDNEVISMGANDCPKFNGGLYWTEYNDEIGYHDEEFGKDYKRGSDSNKDQFKSIAQDVLCKLGYGDINEGIDKLKKTALAELTEYGRVVHAEMEALAMCARNNISCKNADMYVTTFPCHNCAKHIIASGIKKVYYIEAYPKSKALEFYNDSTSKDTKDEGKKVVFVPFFGVGPRRYRELFAMNANPLPNRIRKDKENYGKKFEWTPQNAHARSQMLPTSYIDREVEYAYYYQDAIKIKALKECNGSLT